MTPEGRAEEMLLDYLLKAYKITPQSRTQVKTLVAAAIAQAVQEERERGYKAFKSYAVHHANCAHRFPDKLRGGACNCGFDEILGAVRAEASQCSDSCPDGPHVHREAGR